MKTSKSLPMLRCFVWSLAALAIAAPCAFAAPKVAPLNQPYTVDIELQKPVAVGTELKVTVYVIDRDPNPTTGASAHVRLAGANEAVPNSGLVQVTRSGLFGSTGISAKFVFTPKNGATRRNLLIMVKEHRPQGGSRVAKGYGVVAVRDVTNAPVSTPIGVGGH